MEQRESELLALARASGDQGRSVAVAEVGQGGTAKATHPRGSGL